MKYLYFYRVDSSFLLDLFPNPFVCSYCLKIHWGKLAKEPKHGQPLGYFIPTLFDLFFFVLQLVLEKTFLK